MDKSLCGARGWIRAVKDAGAVVLHIHNQLVRGDWEAIGRLAMLDLTVEPHWGPRPDDMDDVAWAFVTRGTPNAWKVYVAVGTLVE